MDAIYKQKVIYTLHSMIILYTKRDKKGRFRGIKCELMQLLELAQQNPAWAYRARAKSFLPLVATRREWEKRRKRKQVRDQSRTRTCFYLLPTVIAVIAIIRYLCWIRILLLCLPRLLRRSVNLLFGPLLVRGGRLYLVGWIGNG